MNDQSQIGFEQLGIGDLLKRYRLQVPANQRDYAWEKEQVATLFEDLARAISEDENHYFLGTIVTVPRDNGLLEVVDGQQRLATTSLALAAMRHMVKDTSPNLARALDDFLSSVDPRTLEHSPKMTLNSSDRDVFHNLIQEGQVGPGYIAGRTSHQNLRDAFFTAQQRWKDISKTFADSDKVDIFKRWMNYIQFNAKVILLLVPNTVNAFKMFETLNDRGLKTSQADLVKNYVFGQTGEHLANAQQVWGYIKGSLEAVDEEDITVNFLRQALICQHGYLREANVYEKVQTTVRGQNSAMRYLTELEILSRDYAAIFNFGSEKWAGYPHRTRKSLEVLNLFDIKPFRPLMLAVARHFKPEQASLAFEKLVSLGVRLLIASSTRSGSVEQPLARAAYQVYNKDVTSAKDLFKSLGSIIPSDEQLKSAFETTTVSNPKFARYYLRTLEKAFQNDSEPWFLPNEDPSEITLEHVLPQRPADNWPHFSEDEVKLYARRVGNLVLLPSRLNADLGNKTFQQKVEAYKAAPYGTTSMVGQCFDWTAESISERQRELSELAVKAWPFPK